MFRYYRWTTTSGRLAWTAQVRAWQACDTTNQPTPHRSPMACTCSLILPCSLQTAAHTTSQPLKTSQLTLQNTTSRCTCQTCSKIHMAVVNPNSNPAVGTSVWRKSIPAVCSRNRIVSTTLPKHQQCITRALELYRITLHSTHHQHCNTCKGVPDARFTLQ